MAYARYWGITLGFSAALAAAMALAAFGHPAAALVVPAGPSSASGLTLFSITLTYALAVGVPSALVLPPLMHAVRHARSSYRAALSLVAPPILTVPCTLLGTGVLVCLGLVPAADLWTRWQVDVRISLLISSAIGVASMVIGYLRAVLQRTQLALKTEELARARAEKLASEARLASLTSRLQPHFLFNTLNSISSLIRTDPVRAERVLGSFAALLRSSLDARQGELVTLRKELKLVADYLGIQHVRYGPRLRYELDIPALLLEARVPPFSIQTLVENSVKYAVAPTIRGSMIRCLARAHGAQLCLEVWDEGPGFSVEQIRPEHGIDNLRERLRSIYGSAARLVIERDRSCSPERTRVVLELPLKPVDLVDPVSPVDKAVTA